MELSGYNAEKLSMAFEDQLKRVLEAAVAELTALAAVEHDAARKEGLDRGRTLGWEDGLEHGRFEGRQAAEEEGRAALEAAVVASRAEVALDLAATERLVDAMRAMDRARSLRETLDTLAGCAAREASRSAVLLIRRAMSAGAAPRLQVFRLDGLDLSDRELVIEDATVVAAALDSRALATGGSSGDPSAPSFAKLAPDHACLAAPIVLAGEVVAILYADQQGSTPAAATSSWPETLEVLTRHAAKCLEALTAIKAARVLTGASGNGAHASAMDTEDADTSARRYARLLVSEIKLYHEPAVVAGQRERDLGARLGGEIARARVLYEQRVPAAVRQRTDYFHDELVRTLANGDATLLQLT